MLLKLLPDVYNSYLQKREQIEQNLNNILKDIESKAKKIDDDLVRNAFISQQQAIVYWDYRDDLLEAILQTLNEYQLIPFQQPPTATIIEDTDSLENK